VAFQQKCLNKMNEVSKSGRTILFVSHNMAAVRALCTRGILLSHGDITHDGRAEEVVDRYMAQVSENSVQASQIFPICNPKHGICTNDCSVRLENNEAGTRLVVEIEIESAEPVQNIGIGLSIDSLDGIKISMLSSALTNYK